ncbi:hypothetical protein L873DRAFT_515895 [Choiromyces venosus 120613-1]|uniref:Uncharacterized protein n=1 Tax=Choiromyces venosus 120613-1 TaxID=1336337 RepID=A0A3N4K6K3_9PEZI|nr:hypothetical protein L873DRAFT_48328 [Choiromyces venosus 120613-1]RPB05566.1 hypothetical protein L873DRAFT_515895 [Choiromyces venosus 120613-1]
MTLPRPPPQKKQSPVDAGVLSLPMITGRHSMPWSTGHPHSPTHPVTEGRNVT